MRELVLFDESYWPMWSQFFSLRHLELCGGFHSLVLHRPCLHLQFVDAFFSLKKKKQKRSPALLPLCVSAAFPPKSNTRSELPGVSQGHLRNLYVHLHRVVGGPVPPVGDRFLIGCRNVGQILEGDRGAVSANIHTHTHTLRAVTWRDKNSITCMLGGLILQACTDEKGRERGNIHKHTFRLANTYLYGAESLPSVWAWIIYT